MTERRQAVILAGGKGTRLAERLNGRPKSLVDIDGVPLLARQFAALREASVRDIVLLANHEIAQIDAFCRETTFADFSISIIDDGEPRGTAGALLHAFDALAKRFIVIYGDTLFDVDLDRFWRAHVDAGASATLFLHPNDHPFDSDLVEIDDQHKILAFHPPPHGEDEWLPNRVNAALYVLEREAIAFWCDAPTPSDIAGDLFPAMLQRGAAMHGYVSFEYIKDIGTPKRLDVAVSHLRRGVVARAKRDHPQALVFIDRDGTINALNGHLVRAEDFTLIEGAARAIRDLNDAEYRVVVATNQPVLARGETSFGEMRRIHAKMETQIGKIGAFIDRVELCPHHPDKGFLGEVAELKTPCECRKPSTLMIERARAALNGDCARSWFIGDSTGDMLCAARAGLRSILVSTGEAGHDAKYAVRPDYSAVDLAAAADFILHGHARLLARAEAVAQGLPAGTLVLIGGLAKQGKSSLASAVREAMRCAGRVAEVFSLDGYLRDNEHRDSDVLERLDLEAARRDLSPWLEGGQLDLAAPHYEPDARKPTTETIHIALPADGVLIVEGVLALSLLGPEYVARTTRRVFVEGDQARRSQRMIADSRRRGCGEEASLQIYTERQNDEASLVMRQRGKTEMVLSLDDVFSSST